MREVCHAPRGRTLARRRRARVALLRRGFFQAAMI
jgi:hypothetical protein